MTTRMMTDIYDKFEFGKHKGKTLRFVMDNDPSYILWCAEQKIVEFTKAILDTAEQQDDERLDSWDWNLDE